MYSAIRILGLRLILFNENKLPTLGTTGYLRHINYYNLTIPYLQNWIELSIFPAESHAEKNLLRKRTNPNVLKYFMHVH
jgi:hypothetical protein